MRGVAAPSNTVHRHHGTAHRRGVQPVAVVGGDEGSEAVDGGDRSPSPVELKTGDGRPPDSSPRLGGRPGIHVQDVARSLQGRPMRVPAHHDRGSGRWDLPARIVNDPYEQRACTDRCRVRQLERPRSVIGVPPHGHNGGEGFEFEQDVRTADVTGVHDEVDVLEEPWGRGVKRSMSIGDDSDDRGKADAGAQSPSAFFRAGTRLRDTGTWVPSRSFSVSSSVPPYMGTTSRTWARLTR